MALGKALPASGSGLALAGLSDPHASPLTGLPSLALLLWPKTKERWSGHPFASKFPLAPCQMRSKQAVASEGTCHYLVLQSLASSETFGHRQGVPHKRDRIGASLVAQWLGVCLPMQGARVRAPVWEDPTCRGATGPVSHNY